VGGCGLIRRCIWPGPGQTGVFGGWRSHVRRAFCNPPDRRPEAAFRPPGADRPSRPPIRPLGADRPLQALWGRSGGRTGISGAGGADRRPPAAGPAVRQGEVGGEANSVRRVGHGTALALDRLCTTAAQAGWGGGTAGGGGRGVIGWIFDSFCRVRYQKAASTPLDSHLRINCLESLGEEVNVGRTRGLGGWGGYLRKHLQSALL
jgi:hypothetical protein